MLYARIDLYKTNYTALDCWQYITNPDIDQLNSLYMSYCRYRNFRSVMPIFDIEYTDPNSDIIGYYIDDAMVAFSLIRRYNNLEAECIQFAWNYNDPKLKLGIASLKNECAIYKYRGFRYLYLGSADEYKKQIVGFEILGPVQ